MKRVDRRRVLRGTGLAMALPWLEGLAPRAARAQAGQRPRRIIFEFKPNGDEVERRFRRAHETEFELDEFLAPLEPYRDQLLFLNRLDKRYHRLPADQRADRHQQGGSGLAPWPSGEGNFPVGGENRTVGYVLGPSADYAIGDRVVKSGAAVAHRHLVYRVGSRHNDIWNLHAHGGPVGKKNPIAPEVDPFAAYARLFAFDDTEEGRARLQRQLGFQRSALDQVHKELQALASQLGRADRERLEQHAEAVRDIERGLGMAATPVMCPRFSLGEPVNALQDDRHAEVGGLFFKIMARALACDISRVVNFNWHGNTSNRVYRNLGLSDGHHDISHRSDAASFAAIRKIHAHLWTQSLALYKALQETPDGDGTLWDNTLVVHWNELGQGDVHSMKDNLVVFAGGAQGHFKRGRYIDFANQASFSDMLVTCFHFMGFADVRVFGDERLASGGPLAGVTR